MDIVFLTNFELVESLAPLDSGLAGKYFRSALTEAQEIDLKNILGSSLLNALKYRVLNKQVSGPYHELLDKIQYYLAYATIVHLIFIVNLKIANAGVLKTGDENMAPSAWTEMTALRDYYQKRADFFCYELQLYILKNKSLFPELDSCACEKIKSNLKSAATTGLWLGGVRDKYLGSCNCSDDSN